MPSRQLAWLLADSEADTGDVITLGRSGKAPGAPFRRQNFRRLITSLKPDESDNMKVLQSGLDVDKKYLRYNIGHISADNKLTIVSHLAEIEGPASLREKLVFPERDISSTDKTPYEAVQEMKREIAADSETRASSESYNKVLEQISPSKQAMHSTPELATTDSDEGLSVFNSESSKAAENIKLDFFQQVARRMKEGGLQRVVAKSVSQSQELRRLAVTQASAKPKATEHLVHSTIKVIPLKGPSKTRKTTPLQTPTQLGPTPHPPTQTEFMSRQPITPFRQHSHDGECACIDCLDAAQDSGFAQVEQYPVTPTLVDPFINPYPYLPSALPANQILPAAIRQGPRASLHQTIHPDNQLHILGSHSANNCGLAFPAVADNYGQSQSVGSYRPRQEWDVPIEHSEKSYDHMSGIYGSSRRSGSRGRGNDHGRERGTLNGGRGSFKSSNRGSARRRGGRAVAREIGAPSRGEIAARAYLSSDSYTAPKP